MGTFINDVQARSWMDSQWSCQTILCIRNVGNRWTVKNINISMNVILGHSLVMITVFMIHNNSFVRFRLDVCQHIELFAIITILNLKKNHFATTSSAKLFMRHCILILCYIHSTLYENLIILFSFRILRTGIIIKFLSEANTSWSETKKVKDSDGKEREETENLTGHEEYFQIQYYLLGGKNSNLHHTRTLSPKAL